METLPQPSEEISANRLDRLAQRHALLLGFGLGLLPHLAAYLVA